MIFSFFILNCPSFVFAQPDLRNQINAQIDAGTRAGGLPAPKDPRAIVAGVIKILLSIVGIFFLSLVILGGYWHVTAKGDETQIDKAKDTIKAAIFGLLIVMIAYSVTIFVGQKFGAAVIEGGQTTTDTRLER